MANTTRIFLSPPHLSGLEMSYIQSAFDKNYIAPVGDNINEFEHLVGAYLNNQNVVALNSGSAALHLALKCADVKEGDVVMVQSFTFTASANVIKYVNAIPYFIDSELDTWNICPDLLQKAIIDCKNKNLKIKALIATDLFGMPAKWNEINAICKSNNITIIQDSAEALGSKIDNEPIGNQGDYAVFSFNGNKIITTSGGGMLICPVPEKAKQALHLATQAKDVADHYLHTQVGFNYRMSNILAGIGIAQFNVLQKRVEARRNIFSKYASSLSDFNFQPEIDVNKSNRWLTVMLCKSQIQRENIQKLMFENGIEVRRVWKPMHLQPVFEKEYAQINGHSEQIFELGLCLPSGSQLTDAEQNEIISLIKSVN